MLMNDDVIVRTSAWDRKIAELGRTISDGIFLAYPNDLHIGKRMCTFPILTKKACELLLRPYPEEYKTPFIDWHVSTSLSDFALWGMVGYSILKMLFSSIVTIWRERQSSMLLINLRTIIRTIGIFRTYALCGNKWQNDLPRQLPIDRSRICSFLPAPALRPDKASTVLLRYISECLGDSVLPMEERMRLFIWLTGRYLRHQKYLPKKKPSRKAIQELNIF